MLLFSFFILQLFLIVPLNASEKFKDEYLIRRAYLDVLNVVPTVEEIEYYIVYNKSNSYQLAVEFLLSQKNKSWNIDNQIGKALLTSNEYKVMPLRPLSKEVIDRTIMYVVGDLRNNNNVEKSIDKLIEISEKMSSDTLDRIDYICSCLMSRTTTLTEANTLLTVFKSEPNEKAAWLSVMNAILELPEVCCK